MLQSSSVIILFFPGPTGGAEKIVADGYKNLLNKKFPVELWIIEETRNSKAFRDFKKLVQDVPIKEFKCDSIIDTRLLKELKREIKESQAHTLHAHGFKAAIYGYLCRGNKKFITTHHGKTGHTLKVKFYELLEDMVMRRADKVISVSQKMKEDLKSKRIKSQLIDNFLTHDLNSPKSFTPQNKSDLKLLYVGRLSPEKGCSTLIEALNKITDKNISLTIVGDGVEKKILETKNKNSNVVFLGFRSDILNLLSNHDALVMPSYTEGLPLTLIEATCMGLPIIASKVGGIPELVDEGLNGLLIPPKDPVALEGAIKELMTHFDNYQQNAIKLSSVYQERYSPENWVRKTLEVYKLDSQLKNFEPI